MVSDGKVIWVLEKNRFQPHVVTMDLTKNAAYQQRRERERQRERERRRTNRERMDAAFKAVCAGVQTLGKAKNEVCKHLARRGVL